MTLSPTSLFMNWTGVTVTPAGASAIAIGEITDLVLDGKSAQKSFYGDNRDFPRLIRNTAKTRMCKIVGGNAVLMLMIPENVPCVIVAVLNDALNKAQAGGGGYTFTITGAVRESLPLNGKNNEYADGTVTFNCQSDPSSDADPFGTPVAL